MKNKTKFKKLDEKSVALLRKLALEEVKNEKNSGAINQYGNLPLAELAYADYCQVLVDPKNWTGK